jgi:hypothetical protein
VQSIRPLSLLALLAAIHPAPCQISTSIQVGKPDKPVVGLPFTADQSVHTVTHLANGTLITHQMNGHVYRSAEGVERYDGDMPSTDPAHPDPTTMVLIIDRTRHTSILLNSRLKTAVRQDLPPVATVTVNLLPLQIPPGQRQIKPENLVTTDLGKQTVEFLDIVGKRVSGAIPAGKVGNDQPLPVIADVWYAPSLKLIVKQIDKNPLGGERTFELTNIRSVLPDPQLFQIPDGYTVTDRPPVPTTPAQIQALKESAPPSLAATPEQRTRQIEDALNNPDPVVRNTAIAAEDRRNAGVALGYMAQLAGSGDEGATRLAAGRAAMAAETIAAAAETAAAAVESDAARATAAAATGDRTTVDRSRDKAASDYAALLAADDRLAKAASDLAAAAAGNAAFYAASPGAAAINDLGAQDASVAANLLSAAAHGGTADYSAAAANQATAINDADILAGLDGSRAPSFQAVAKAEAEAQSATIAAASAGNASAAAAAVATAATAGATADGTGNPYAAAVETAAAAIANAASATISARYAMDKLKSLK